ncbi:hypothetical protein Pmani_017050 [Petrolisthes manimaculis]|uniref:Reverse transcriptase n=1 Tax=Petrolisthes manimaculis TaxID=1843537 RepID=A0AAE1PQJ7_9EUCA|nr:hypothetical protein Pmani_017050 [Petrolisthes manimaculis]
MVGRVLQDNNYVINTPDRRKSQQLIRVNLIKKYHERLNEEEKANVMLCINSNTSRDGNEDLTTSWSSLKNSEIISNIPTYFNSLNLEQQQELQLFFTKYFKLFTDFPKKCPYINHEIKVIPGAHPIRRPAYRISPRKTELMRQEVDYLLQNQLAIPSCSPWASPSILVPKEGGRPLPKPSLPRSLIFWGEVLRPYNTQQLGASYFLQTALLNYFCWDVISNKLV